LKSDSRGHTIEGNHVRTLAILVVTGLLAPAVVRGQRGGEPLPAVSADSLAGSVSFDVYCASCHGRTGEGNAPAAQSLRTAPGDLTLLTRRNGGTFPRERVTATIDGSGGTPIHGGPDMPVWGPTFRALEPDGREAIRLRNVVAFVESIQRPASATGAIPIDANGAALYRDYCTSCHGAKGLGSGPFTFALRTVPPNLTTLAQRNGGSFPRDRVSRVIEGADVRAHGGREMPVWGNVFRRLRPRDPSAAARITALVDFLESIQSTAPAQSPGR
jgi:mono/diheme cytochrome c family protein